ncbi:hypothetical protein [Serpentinicella alkaliphila]|uniref:Uncharacterized protein n=1 Tax=Serpentinicella alkaliphila TaxID=1734049 RepID=A0A4R2SSR8_9FIRM|nr:hypothetical protein [Serpentinicella alkaliphila]QUH27043.1 hypothetical protein HZR23_15830 [Serpentinicella alkaliphila]TCP93397.1 hypothetical protein EDD79_10782 [Serpentinicella alkaliphila]
MTTKLYKAVFQSQNINIDNLPVTAYNDLRVATLTLLASWTFAYTINTDIVIPETSGASASVTQNNSKGILQTGTLSNSMARIKSRKFSIYAPGMGLLVNFTATFTQGVTGSTQSIGLGDELDGLFFWI